MINKINPLYILIFLVFIAIASFFKVSSIQKSVNSKNIEIVNIEKEAKEIRALKSLWDDEQRSRGALDSILSLASISKFAPTREQTRRGVERVMLSNIDHKSAELVVNRVLNSSLKIESLEITRENEHNMSIILEVGI